MTANTTEPTVKFSSDEKAAEYWSHEARSTFLGVYDRIEAIKAFREERADVLLPDSQTLGWRTFRLRDFYAAQREEVRTMTKRLRGGLINASLA